MVKKPRSRNKGGVTGGVNGLSRVLMRGCRGLIREQLLQLAGGGFTGIALTVANPRDGGLAATHGAGDGGIAPAVPPELLNGVLCVHRP